ncbi:MAG TPA: HEAT repeat domain-containing protein [Verrucomicrobiae bacterium]|nr:HEAT repeat domain-containing protein [Verrucomicrobiae bacterium]
MLAHFFWRQPYYQGRPLSAWVADIESQSPTARQKAIEAINAIGPQAVPYLSQTITKTSGPLQAAIDVLSAHTPPRLKAFGRRFYRPGDTMMKKHAAACAFMALGTNGGSGAPALSRLLRNPSSLLSGIAGNAMAQIGPASVPFLIEALDDQDYTIRSSACNGLGKLGTNAAPAVPRLANIVEAETGPITTSASFALYQIGPPAVPRLVAMLASTNRNVRRMAAYALTSPQGASTAPPSALIAAARDPDDHVRWNAAAALSQVIDPPPEVERALLEALSDRNPNVRSTAASTFGYRYRFVQRHLPEFISLLQDDSPEVRSKAAFALGQAGYRATNAVPPLTGLLADTNRTVSAAAAEALREITNSAPPHPVVPRRAAMN